MTEITRDADEDEDVGRLASWIFRLTCPIGLVAGFSGVVTVVAVGRDKLEDREMVVVAKLSNDCHWKSTTAFRWPRPITFPWKGLSILLKIHDPSTVD